MPSDEVSNHLKCVECVSMLIRNTNTVDIDIASKRKGKANGFTLLHTFRTSFFLYFFVKVKTEKLKTKKNEGLQQ